MAVDQATPTPVPGSEPTSAFPRPIRPASISSGRFVLMGKKGVYTGQLTWSGDVPDPTGSVYPTFDNRRADEHIRTIKNEARNRGETVSVTKVPARPDKGFNITIKEFENQKLQDQLDGILALHEDDPVEEAVEGEEGGTETKKKPSRRGKKKHEEESE